MKNILNRIKALVKKYWWLAVIWYGMKFSLLIYTVLWLTSCDKEYSKSQGHLYTFSCLVEKDQWGIETWGAHQFVVKDKITDIGEFKECYVKYLCWSGLNTDCFYKKQYYIDDKYVKIRYEGTTYTKWTLESINDCNIEKQQITIIGWIK